VLQFYSFFLFNGQNAIQFSVISSPIRRAGAFSSTSASAGNETARVFPRASTQMRIQLFRCERTTQLSRLNTRAYVWMHMHRRAAPPRVTFDIMENSTRSETRSNCAPLLFRVSACCLETPRNSARPSSKLGNTRGTKFAA